MAANTNTSDQKHYLDHAGLVALIAQIKKADAAALKKATDILGITALATEGANKDTIVDRLAALETLAGDTSVAAQIKAAIEKLDTPEGGVSSAAVVDGTEATEGTPAKASTQHVSVNVVEADGIITGVTVTEADIASKVVLDEEIARAKAAEGDLQDAIDAEKERAEGAESDLQDAIDAEEAARKAQIGELGKVSAEDGAADHTVKSYVDAKVEEINGEAEDLEGRVEDLEALHAKKNDAFVSVAQEAKDAIAAIVEVSKDNGTGDLVKVTVTTEAGSVKSVAVDDSALDVEVAKVTTLIGDDANKSVRTIANEELAKQLIPENAKESLDTLQEIAAWIQAHPDDASAMNTAITNLQTQVGTEADGDTAATGLVADIRALEDLVGDADVEAQIKAITGTPDQDKTLQAEIDDVEGRLDVIEGEDEGSIKKAVADEATRINGIVGTPDEGKTIQAEIDDVEAAIDAMDKSVTITAAENNGYINATLTQVNGAITAFSVDCELRACSAEDVIALFEGTDAAQA